VTLLRYADLPDELRGDDEGGYSVILHRRTPISAPQISKLLGLTPAESELAKLLVQGDSLSEAAEKLNRSRATARVQLAAIFDKTGVHKQHQLISHILHIASRFSP